MCPASKDHEQKLQNAENALSWQHRVTPEQLASRLVTSLKDGLSSQTARKRLEKHGPNTLSPSETRPWWKQLLLHFADFFSLLLLAAAVLCVVAYGIDPSEDIHLYLANFLFIVVVATSLFSFAQQYKSDKTLREFRNLLPPKATVRRDNGQLQLVSAADLVIGDIVRVQTGEKIPADLRIIENHRLSVDNSALTGESEPCERTVHSSSESPLETSNLAFFGTLAVDGSATGVVIATGDNTVFGQVANLVADAQTAASATTLHRDIHHFVVIVTAFAVSVGLFFFAVGIYKGIKILRNIVNSIGIIVSNVPEGLLATVTVSLTASARRMARRNVLVKNLEAIETLGSTTVICSDKTGTLTQNRMSVSHLVCAGRIEPAQECIATYESAKLSQLEPSFCNLALPRLINSASLCSTAVFDRTDMNQNPTKTVEERIICGDASESGILRFTEKFHETEKFRAENAQIACIPFNSTSKIMVTVHQQPESATPVIAVMKGAPERVLRCCSRIICGASGGERQLTDQDRNLLEKQLQYLANRGERILAFASLELSPQDMARLQQRNEDDDPHDVIPVENYCFVGLISLVDPPRPNVPNAVEKCKEAGIRVIMVTGDHPSTALSIAKKVGIVDKSVTVDEEECDESETAVVVQGSDIENFLESDWERVLGHEQIVFARTAPHQKLAIVRELQNRGHVVAATGDGVNDAPALKKANTGIAMGISGSDVSREAADIVLLDDNFASIVSGVEEGRLIFDNLKKSISYTLTSNVPQLVPLMVYLILHIPLPLTTVLILVVDLGTDIFPAISLAYEEAEWDLMRRPPRRAHRDRLVSLRLLSFSMLQLGIMQSFGGFFAYFAVFNAYGLSPKILSGLDREGHFGTERVVDQRWMYTSQTRPDGFSFSAKWFDRDTASLSQYFDSSEDEILRQETDQYSLLLPLSPSTLNGSNVPSSEQFNDMVKTIGIDTGRPSCLSFFCNSTRGIIRNSNTCFDTAKSTVVYLSGIYDGTTNDQIVPGRSQSEGCFELWTPRQERAILRRAQTAFFAAIVVAQMFTLLVTKTRILSLFQQGVHNSAVVCSLLAEAIIALLVVYVPAFQQGLNVVPLRLIEWLPGVPFGLFIVVYDEARKFFVRRHMTRCIAVQEGTAGAATILDSVASFIHKYTLW